jgi:predicted nucleotidyltransferase
MDSTYNPHDREGGAWGHGLYVEKNFIDNIGRVFQRIKGHFTYEGCQMKLFYEQDPNTVRGEKMYEDGIYTFSLSDVDPASVVVSGRSVTFETRGQAPLILEDFDTVYPTLQGNEHEIKGRRKTFVAEFFVDDVFEYGERLAKALRHAVQLCGGKPSPF